MDIQVHPCDLSGTPSGIPSKSQLHRIFLGSALAKEPTKIYLSALCEDTVTTLDVLVSLGANVVYDEQFITISPLDRSSLSSDYLLLQMNESGSTLRFLLPVLSALDISCKIMGKGRLKRRPIKELKQCLAQHGALFSGKKNIPFGLSGQLTAGTFSIPGNVSSQYITGLLFALPLLQGDSEIILTSPLSSPSYVAITLDILRQFSIIIEPTPKGYLVKGNQTYHSPSTFQPEVDWSNQAFWVAAGVFHPKIILQGLPFHSLQGDKRILSVLSQSGCILVKSKEGLSIKQKTLKPLTFSIDETPDLLPILSVVFSLCQGTTTLLHIHRTTQKECNRVEAICENINALGGKITLEGNALKIQGISQFQGGKVGGFQDHRIIMSMVVAASLSKNPIVIEGVEAVAKSYPHFFEDFAKLGGSFHVI